MFVKKLNRKIQRSNALAQCIAKEVKQEEKTKFHEVTALLPAACHKAILILSLHNKLNLSLQGNNLILTL